MKQFFTLCMLLFLGVLAWGQEQKVRVVLKNNTIVTGVMKEFNPTSHIVVNVAGFDTKIDMADVAEVKTDSPSVEPSVNEEYQKVSDLIVPDELLKLEDYPYPEEYVVDYKGQQIEFVLVRGGVFQMGYEGHGSMRMDSEPVHDVFVSSYYISIDCLTEGIVRLINGKTAKSSDSKIYETISWDKANALMELLSQECKIPMRLPTEAEWEYVVSRDEITKQVNFIEGEVDHCFDNWAPYPYPAKYTKKEYQALSINPMGPDKGRSHVKRTYGSTKDIYCDRSTQNRYVTTGTSARVRIVIPAKFFIK